APAGDQRTCDRAEEEDRDRQLLLAVRLQAEVLLHEEHRAADDAGVVAEQETAERGDRRDPEQALVAQRLAVEVASGRGVSAHCLKTRHVFLRVRDSSASLVSSSRAAAAREA